MSAVNYLGFAKVGDQMPLIVWALEKDREEVLKRHPPGGVIFTDAHDMPSLEALLEANRVSYTVLERPLDISDELESFLQGDWRAQAKARLAETVANRDRGDFVFTEDLSFVPSLSEEELDNFLAEAEVLLKNNVTTEDDWRGLLLGEDQRVAQREGQTVVGAADAPEAESERTPLFTLDDLDLRWARGAMGGPTPLTQLD